MRSIDDLFDQWVSWRKTVLYRIERGKKTEQPRRPMQFSVTALLVLTAFFALLFAWWPDHQKMGVQEPPQYAPPKTTEIIVAAVDIPRGVPLRPEMVRVQEWPEGLVPPGAILSMEDIEGRATMTPLATGEPILESKVVEAGGAKLVKPGTRAFTIATPTSSAGVAGLLQPENRVDVLLTVNQGEAVAGGGTWTLLQNVEILAASQRQDNSDGKTATALSNVTLHVTPDMAAKLTLAQTVGVLTLTLRNDADDAITATRPITRGELLFLQEAIAAPTVDASAERDSPSGPTLILRKRSSSNRVLPDPLERKKLKIAGQTS